MSAVLLASGGLDSTALAYWLIRRNIDFIPVFVDYGQHSRKTEFATLRRVLPVGFRNRILRVNVGTVYERCASRMLQEADLWCDAVTDDDLYVPYRNQLLLSVGAAVARGHQCNAVYSAFIESNLARAEDCSTAFLTELAQLTRRFGGVQLRFPFKDMSKSQVARVGIRVGAPIGETYSCLVRARTPCGVCPNCVDRAAALSAVGKTRQRTTRK